MGHSTGVDTTADPTAQRSGSEPDAKFRLMFERSADAILLLDTRSNLFVEYNEAAVDLLRCSRAELRALHPSSLSPLRQPDGRDSYEKANEMIATAVRNGSHRFEWVHCSPHRPDFPVEVLLTPIQLGNAPIVVVVWRDITDRKKEEEALRQAQKAESLGVLAGGIAHDFNNLLAVMTGHLDLARAMLPPDHAAVKHLVQISDAARNAAVLTQQMLAYSGKGAFAVAPADLSRAVSDMAALLEVSIPKSVRLHLALPADLPAIEADRAQLQQVIMNLVTNAAEAIDAQRGGTIELRTAVEELDAERVRRDFAGQELRPGRCVTLTVHDTGQGMNPEVLARIFDPFFSTKRSGRGLGLAALRGILKAHRAGIHIGSEPGAGTTVLVCFPASQAVAAAATPEPRPSARTAPAQGTILLVDDEAKLRGATRGLLELVGFEVLEAGDGEGAVELVREHTGRLTCVIMDLTMGGMDGYQAFVALRELDAHVPVIVSSGWSESSVSARFAKRPPNAFLEKPFSLADLEAALGRVGVL